jgi:hypothetical protein
MPTTRESEGNGYGEAAECGIGALEDARSIAASLELAVGTYGPRVVEVADGR